MNFLRFFFIFLTISSCSYFNSKEEVSSKSEEITKKKRINPNAEERAKEARDKGYILFGKKVGENSVVSFSTSNVMWRASLEVLSFMPIQTTDYAGGVISTDWYKKNLSDKDEIKIRVQFLSNELSPSSLKIVSHKKVCNELNNCKIILSSEKLTKTIKKKIIEKAREIKISDDKKNKN